MNEHLKAIYALFKPMPNTLVWGDESEVCVSYPETNGYMRWFDDCGVVRFEYVTLEQELANVG